MSSNCELNSDKICVEIKISFDQFLKRWDKYFCHDICCLIFSYIFDPLEYLKMITEYSNKENYIVTYDIKEYELVSRYINNKKCFITFWPKKRKQKRFQTSRNTNKNNKNSIWGKVSLSPIENCEQSKEGVYSLI